MPQNASHDLIEMLAHKTKEFVQDIIQVVQSVERQHKVEDLGMRETEQDEIERKLVYDMLDAAPVIAVELVDGVDDPVILLTTRTTEQMFGYFSGELNGQPISILIPADKRLPHKSHILKLLQHPAERQMGAATDVKPEGVDKAGNRFPIELSWRIKVIDKRRFLIATVMRQLRGQSVSS